jgi:hypothetical protein
MRQYSYSGGKVAFDSAIKRQKPPKMAVVLLVMLFKIM